ncbi:ribosomal L7Ae/L30e/S12e/Gadd45 family protein [Candidatus Woesearchaeota archaeon]|nr:ribosomal L7Ae/L30e/S12e/Gadd45 family protein [Candidatus Woesearchaeota archaeon]
MAKKKAQTESPAYELRKLMETKKVVVGTDRVIKQMKLGKISKVFLTVNCPEDVKAEVGAFAKISKTEVVQLDIPNDELGVVCKKPFSISIAGIMKE